MPSGAFIQKLNARTIQSEGSDISLTKNTPLPLKAIKVDDQRRIFRMLAEDGLEPGEKTPVVFVFSGSLHGPACPFVHDDTFRCAGSLYTVDSLHPVLVGGICTELPVLVYKD